MHRTRRLALLLGAALALLLSASSLASAAGPEKIVQGRYLQIVSSMSDGADNLSPGDGARWTVGVSADGAEDGMIRRTLVVDGALAPYVLVSVESCASRPSGDACPDATTLVKEHAPTAGRTIDLGSQNTTSQDWLAVRVTLSPEAPDSARALAGSLRLHARGAGEDIGATPPGGDGDGSGGDGSDEAGSGGSDGSDGPPGSSDGSGDGSGPAEGPEGSVHGDTGDQAGVGNQASVQQGLPGFLASTGFELVLWLLAAATITLVGAHLRCGRSVR